MVFYYKESLGNGWLLSDLTSVLSVLQLFQETPMFETVLKQNKEVDSIPRIKQAQVLEEVSPSLWRTITLT